MKYSKIILIVTAAFLMSASSMTFAGIRSEGHQIRQARVIQQEPNQKPTGWFMEWLTDFIETHLGV